MRVTYAGPEDPDLQRLRAARDLDRVAGRGDEIERMVRLMRWAFRLARHANHPEFPEERNAFTLIEMAPTRKQSLHCTMKAIILHEALLSLGFQSRLTHLLPHSNEDQESHVVTSVTSRSHNRWVFLDADFDVFVTDERNRILGVMAARRRLVEGKRLRVHHVGRSAFGIARVHASNLAEGASYPWFLTEFVFKTRCPAVSRFNHESAPGQEYVELLPSGYRSELVGTRQITPRGTWIRYTNDARGFWSAPQDARQPVPG